MSNLNLNALLEEHARLKEEENRGSFLQNFVKMPEGKGSVTLRLLPPAVDGTFGRNDNPFYQWTRIHRVNSKSLHDPRVMVDGRWVGENPIGDYLRWLWKEAEKADEDEELRMKTLYRQIKPIERYYYNCIVREEVDENNNVQKNVGPKILSVGKTLHQIILTGICGDEELGIVGKGDVTDIKNGFDFKIMKTIRKSGKDTFPNYDQSRFVDEPSPLGTPEECEKWLANLNDIVALRVLKTPAELEHELQCHLGLKQDNSGTDFDPSKFQKPVGTVEEDETPTVEVSEPAVSAPDPEPVGEEPDGDTSDLAAEDFINRIKNLPA
jgi:hypothetical protein